MQWEAFSEFPYLSKDRSSKRNSITMNSFQGVSLSRKDWIFSQERRLGLDSTSRQTLPELLYIPPVLRVPFIFPKIIYCLPRGLHLPPHFLLRLYLIQNSKATSLNYPSSCVYLMHEIHVFINLFTFVLLICLLWQKS